MSPVKATHHPYDNASSGTPPLYPGKKRKLKKRLPRRNLREEELRHPPRKKMPEKERLETLAMLESKRREL
jgi:hypothetical protein